MHLDCKLQIHSLSGHNCRRNNTNCCPEHFGSRRCNDRSPFRPCDLILQSSCRLEGSFYLFLQSRIRRVLNFPLENRSWSSLFVAMRTCIVECQTVSVEWLILAGVSIGRTFWKLVGVICSRGNESA